MNLMASASLAIEIGVVYFPHLKGNTAIRFKYASCLLSSYNSVSVLIDKVWKYLPKITKFSFTSVINLLFTIQCSSIFHSFKLQPIYICFSASPSKGHQLHLEILTLFVLFSLTVHFDGVNWKVLALPVSLPF